MKKLITYLRKVIPHSSPIRLWYTRMHGVLAGISLPINTNNLQIIGVTGTDGKTTTVEMIAHMLRELGVPAISASSYAVKKDGDVLTMSKRTTPSAKDVRKLLKQASKDNVKVVVLEVSSHSLVQWRLFGIKTDIAVLTNITHEHLNFHKTKEKYIAAKKTLFTKHLKSAGGAVLPVNAVNSSWLSEFNSCTYTQPQSATKQNGTRFLYDGTECSMPMLGGYNAGNAIAAALAVSSLNGPTSKQGLDVTTDSALQTLKNFNGIPGRMQIVPSDNITIIVDFALTERAMQSALATAREIAGGKKVLLVFGASGGQHDASVHPGLATAAAQGADSIYVTDDEPYDSNPTDIRENLSYYIEKAATDCTYQNIADRREAISAALSQAHNGDVVLITGMGHYKSRTVAGKEIPWNDADVVTEELTHI